MPPSSETNTDIAIIQKLIEFINKLEEACFTDKGNLVTNKLIIGRLKKRRIKLQDELTFLRKGGI